MAQKLFITKLTSKLLTGGALALLPWHPRILRRMHLAPHDSHHTQIPKFLTLCGLCLRWPINNISYSGAKNKADKPHFM